MPSKEVNLSVCCQECERSERVNEDGLIKLIEEGCPSCGQLLNEEEKRELTVLWETMNSIHETLKGKLSDEKFRFEFSEDSRRETDDSEEEEGTSDKT